MTAYRMIFHFTTITTTEHNNMRPKEARMMADNLYPPLFQHHVHRGNFPMMFIINYVMCFQLHLITTLFTLLNR